jgi:hypothetical protein
MRFAFVSLVLAALGCGGLTSGVPADNATDTDAATPTGGAGKIQCPQPVGQYADSDCTVTIGDDAGTAGAIRSPSIAIGSPSSSGGETASFDASSVGDASTACGLSAAEMQALRDRWNAAAMAAATPFDFTWSPCDQFPHPTFKMGTAEAYGEFAIVLLKFFQQGDDFAFLGNNDVFDVPLLYVFPSGQVGLDTTFKQLSALFSSPSGFGNQSAATRQALAGFLARMP